MVSEVKNPFSGLTQPVTKERFIGREDEIRRITEMLVTPDIDEPICNVAVIGMHGIGKSSLIKHILLTYEVELFLKRRLPIWINLKTQKAPLAFFQRLVEATFDELSRNEQYLDKAALERLARYKPEHASFELLFPNNISRFFREVKHAGVHVVFVLDEFDYARTLFAGEHQGFENLRQLSQDDVVSYITLSRREVKDIEIQIMAGSTWEGIFQKQYLAPFNEKDLRQYFSILATSGFIITDAVEKQILAFCGRHPRLLAMFGWELFTSARHTDHFELEQIFNQLQTPYNHYFENIVERIRADQNMDALLHIIFGPKLDVTQKNIDELFSYGLIRKNAERTVLPGTRIVPAYTGFSEGFQRYISDMGREAGLHSFLGETELALRDLVKKVFQKKYKTGWLDELKKRFPGDFGNYEGIQKSDREQGKIGLSEDLLDYTYLSFLCKIIFDKCWSEFSAIFQKDPKQHQQYWKKRGVLISEVRNPVMHFRLENISMDEKHVCKQYCQEIMGIVEEYPG